MVVLQHAKIWERKQLFDNKQSEQYCAKFLLSGILNVVVYIAAEPQVHMHTQTEGKMFSGDSWYIQWPRLKIYRYQCMEQL